MTYRELLNHLRLIENVAPERLDDHVAVIGDGYTPGYTPMFVTHIEWNDGSIEGGAERHQFLLMTV